MTSRAVEAAFILIIALLILIGGKNVLVEITSFPTPALIVLFALGVLEIFALRRTIALGGPSARFLVTRDVAFIAAIASAMLFVYTHYRGAIGSAIAALEFALVLELLGRFNPHAAPAPIDPE
jgi:hypothetical protein